MINWLSSQKRQEKQKIERDAKLKEELAAKIKALEANGKQELDDFTELTINGMRQKVNVDRITIIGVSPITE